MTHESVLLEEALQWLRPGPGKVLVDGTLGRGGHSRAWLERSVPDGQVVGFDRDPQAVLEAGRILEVYGDRAVNEKGNFTDIPEAIVKRRFRPADALLLDLGVSSPQLDEASRGFSFRLDGPLDMRMDPEQRPDAREIVNEASEEALRQILWTYGEERFARSIARRIAAERSKRRIESTKDLEEIIFHAVPRAARHGRIHPATRTFQALRIAVNGELEALQDFLPHALDCVKDGGRVAVISFHSLEDRLVKNAFRDLERLGLGKILTKKPVVAAEEELARNPRSRSAKLRVIEKGPKEASR